MSKYHQRRKLLGYPYYKLATWDAASATYTEGSRTFDSPSDARLSVYGQPGVYRVVEIGERKRSEFAPFSVH